MSLDAKKEKSVETAAAVVPINKNKRYEKEKPWDNDPTLDKWWLKNSNQNIIQMA